ncbi:MAG: hypothetical protein EXR50_01605 [Dehalococcoidia bacterium]|nr:hypothetical protein [Dehalococcoidia bacterium]
MKKEYVVGSRLPENLVRDLEMIENLEQTDRSTTVRKLLYSAVGEWKRDHFARQYAAGKMSLARAAEEVGASLWEMMDYVRQQKLPTQYDADDLKKDLDAVLARRRG